MNIVSKFTSNSESRVDKGSVYAERCAPMLRRSLSRGCLRTVNVDFESARPPQREADFLQQTLHIADAETLKVRTP